MEASKKSFVLIAALLFASCLPFSYSAADNRCEENAGGCQGEATGKGSGGVQIRDGGSNSSQQGVCLDGRRPHSGGRCGGQQGGGQSGALGGSGRGEGGFGGSQGGCRTAGGEQCGSGGAQGGGTGGGQQGGHGDGSGSVYCGEDGCCYSKYGKCLQCCPPKFIPPGYRPPPGIKN